jgi:predicted glycosyltransferase
LLLDNLVYKVESCATEDDKVVVKNNVQTGKPNSCSDKFDYINSQNPEYYAEFKDKPDSMAEKQDDEAKQEENTRITNLYHDVLLEIEEIGKTIHSVE